MSNPITGKQSAGDPLVFITVDEAKKHYMEYVLPTQVNSSFKEWLDNEEVFITEGQDFRDEVREAQEGQY